MTKMRQWSILTVVAVIIVFAAGWFLLVKPQQSKSSTLRSQAATQQSANQQLVSQIAALQAEERNLPQQQAALQKFTTQVPNDAAEPTIIRQLSAAAAGAGVDLVSMTPGTATPVVSTATTVPAGTTAPVAGSTSLTGTTAAGGGLVSLPIAIGITGTYPNVESFFQALEKLPRALMVTAWSLCPDGASATGAAAAPAGTTGASCSLPPVPAGKTLPAGSLGGTLSAVIYYAPPAGATTAAAGSTIAPAAGTTTPTTGTTTPAPTTSTAATTPTTGATTAPAS